LIFWADEIYLFSKVRISMAMAIELWSTLLQQTKVENGNQWRWDKKGIYVKMQSTTDSHFFWLLLGIQIQIVLCWFFGFSVFRLVFTHEIFSSRSRPFLTPIFQFYTCTKTSECVFWIFLVQIRRKLQKIYSEVHLKKKKTSENATRNLKLRAKMEI
jgi:hypothetical protein